MGDPHRKSFPNKEKDFENRKFVKKYHCIKTMFSVRDSFSKCEQIFRKLQIWSHLLKKSLMENFISCAVNFRSWSPRPYLGTETMINDLQWNFFPKKCIKYVWLGPKFAYETFLRKKYIKCHRSLFISNAFQKLSC